MNEHPLDEFLSEDADVYTRRKLVDAIRGKRVTDTPLIREFTFNRFKITLDFQTMQVSIQDDLTPGQEGEYSLPCPRSCTHVVFGVRNNS